MHTDFLPLPPPIRMVQNELFGREIMRHYFGLDQFIKSVIFSDLLKNSHKLMSLSLSSNLGEDI